MSLDDELQDWAEHTRRPAPSASEVQALVDRAEARRAGRRRVWLYGGLAFVVAVPAAMLVLALALPQSPPDEPVAVEGPSPDEIIATEVETTDEIVLLAGVHAVGADRVEVGADSEVVVEEAPGRVDLALRVGRVGVQAAPRPAGESLVVHAGDWDVTVVGTRFEVVEAPFAVHVSEGVVRVTGPETDVLLRAGDALLDGVVRRAPVPVQQGTAEPLPAVEALKQALLAGEVERARNGLERRLDADPDDIDARVLLAQLHRMQGDRDASVAAFREVIARGSPDEAQQARYEASVLLKDDPEAAIPLLTDFLDAPGVIAPEAGLRLGRALIAVGRVDEGRERLQAVIEQFPGSAAAGAARRELEGE